MPHPMIRQVTDAAHELFRFAFLPVMRVWAAAAEDELSGVPRPVDSPFASVPGPEPLRLLIVGGGPAVGWGVFSHSLALPGTLARAVLARTGRGAHVDVISCSRMVAETAPGYLGQVDLRGYDAIIVTVGANEALRLTSVRRWRRNISELLRLLLQITKPATPILLVGVHPIRTIPIFDSRLGSIAARHAVALNRTSAATCAATELTTFVPLPPAPRSSATRFRSPEDYGPWGALLAERVLAALDLVGADARV